MHMTCREFAHASLTTFCSLWSNNVLTSKIFATADEPENLPTRFSGNRHSSKFDLESPSYSKDGVDGDDRDIHRQVFNQSEDYHRSCSDLWGYED